MTIQKIEAHSPETQSADLMASNIAKLKTLFPELITEGSNGAIVNVDVLKTLVGDQSVTDAQEKYGLNWHGKRQARQLALMPSTGTLRPCPDESVDWDTTQNLLIEGDNLEVLKLLQKSYTGKVKMIYIDPPYNTGKDFVYADYFQDNVKNYLQLTGQVEGGAKLTSNTETSGRFHTGWLTMMYPRLILARNLLQDDGFLFISIGDDEVDNLRKICSEIFGDEAFIAQFVWNTEGHTDNQFDVKVNHEYVLLYAKNFSAGRLGNVIDPNTREESNLWKGFAENSITKNGPANPPSEIQLPVNFPCLATALDLPANKPAKEFFDEIESHGYIMREMTESYSVTYPIRLDRMNVASGRLISPCRVFAGWANANKLRAFIENGCIAIDDEGDKVSFFLSDRGVVYYKRQRAQAKNILSVLRNFSTTEKMRSELEAMGIPFQYPKPKELMKYLVQIGCEKDGLIMDFFAGSGSTAHGAWLQGVQDGICRRVVLIQLPEPLDPANEKHRSAVQFCEKLNKPKNIAELTKERLRRVGKVLSVDSQSRSVDLGFRVFKLDASNIRAWNPSPTQLDQALFANYDHLIEDRSELDVLYELLLKRGLDLCVPMAIRIMAGKTVYAVGGGVLIACLATSISAKEVEATAQGIVAWHNELAPAGDSTCVFRDSAFADDVAKTNMAAILEQNGIQNMRSL